MSPTDRWGEVRRKLREYFEIGVSAVLCKSGKAFEIHRCLVAHFYLSKPQKIASFFFKKLFAVYLIVEPKEKTISLFRSPTTLQELTEEEILTLEGILPGFAVPVNSFFARR